MKTIFCLIIFLFTLSDTIFCQQSDSSNRKMSIEVIVQPQMTMGDNYMVPADSANSSTNSKWVAMSRNTTMKFQCGASFGFLFNKKIGINFGVLYSSQGQKYKSYSWSIPFSETFSRSVSLNYLKIPVQLCFISKNESKISFRCSAGFYFGYLLKYSDKSEVTSYTYWNGSNEEHIISIAEKSVYTQTYNYIGYVPHDHTYTFLTKPYKSIDFGATAEIGLQYKLSERISIPILISYQRGFYNIKNSNSQYVSGPYYYGPYFWSNIVGGGIERNKIPYYNSSVGIKTGIRIKF